MPNSGSRSTAPDVGIITTGHDVADARLHKITAALQHRDLSVELWGLGEAGRRAGRRGGPRRPAGQPGPAAGPDRRAAVADQGQGGDDGRSGHDPDHPARHHPAAAQDGRRRARGLRPAARRPGLGQGAGRSAGPADRPRQLQAGRRRRPHRRRRLAPRPARGEAAPGRAEPPRTSPFLAPTPPSGHAAGGVRRGPAGQPWSVRHGRDRRRGAGLVTRPGRPGRTVGPGPSSRPGSSSPTWPAGSGCTGASHRPTPGGSPRVPGRAWPCCSRRRRSWRRCRPRSTSTSPAVFPCSPPGCPGRPG